MRIAADRAISVMLRVRGRTKELSSNLVENKQACVMSRYFSVNRIIYEPLVF